MERCTAARDFVPRQTGFFAGILDGFQEKSGKYWGERSAGWAF
jgi:hypothetical protein